MWQEWDSRNFWKQIIDESPSRGGGWEICKIGSAARAAVQSLVSPPHGRMCHKFVNPYANEDYSVNGVGVLPYQEGELRGWEIRYRLVHCKGFLPLVIQYNTSLFRWWKTSFLTQVLLAYVESLINDFVNIIRIEENGLLMGLSVVLDWQFNFPPALCEKIR